MFTRDDIPQRMPQYDETKIFRETSTLEWYDIITAKELIEQNAHKIASSGAPPNARIVSSSSWLNGQPFSSDMIYGGQHAAQQYNEMLRKLREHTEPQEIQAYVAYCQIGACRIGTNGNLVMGAPNFLNLPKPWSVITDFGLGIADGAVSMWDGIKYMVSHPTATAINLYLLTSNTSWGYQYRAQVFNNIVRSSKDYINNKSAYRVAVRGIFEVATTVFGGEFVKPVEAVGIAGKVSKVAELGGTATKGVDKAFPLKLDLQFFASKGIGKGEQVLDNVKTYEQARNKALDLVGDLGPNSKPYIGTLKSSAGYGKVIGRQSADGKVRWRLDYDPNKGTYINIEDFRNGKGANARKIVIPFEGNESTFKSLLKHLNR